MYADKDNDFSLNKFHLTILFFRRRRKGAFPATHKTTPSDIRHAHDVGEDTRRRHL